MNKMPETYGEQGGNAGILSSMGSLKGSCSCREGFSPSVATPMPLLVEGCTVLVLGGWSGKDLGSLAAQVGEKGSVICVMGAEEHAPMDPETLVALDKRVDIRVGCPDKLKDLGMEDASVDVVAAKGLTQLTPDHEPLLKELLRVLKPGGELLFSCILSGRRVPEQPGPLPNVDGLEKAMYLEDFRRLLLRVGCPDYRTLTQNPVRLLHPELEAKLGMIDFHATTARIFKLDALEDICEDYGQVAFYKGTIPGSPHTWDLDDHHRLITGKPMLVCGNTAAMLEETRFGDHFTIMGDRSTHYGPFDCSPADEKTDQPDGGACC